MSNYVDTIQLEGGTDYPIKVPNGVTYRNPSAMTPSQNPLLRRNDLVQNLSDDEDNPPSSNAVKTVTDGLNSQLTSMIKSKYVEITGLSFTSGSSLDLGTIATATDISGLTYSGIKGLSLLMAGGNQNFDFGILFCNKTNGHMYFRPTTTQSSAYVYFTVLY